MERREFLQLLCMGTCASLAAQPVKAFTAAAILNRAEPEAAPDRAVATERDMDQAKIEETYYGHWRRVNRRHYRRVSRRVYRRHYYY